MNTNIEKMKECVKRLDLNSKYYDTLRENCVKLQKQHPDEGYYDDDGSFIDIYDPNAYTVIIFLIWKDDKVYLGNEQIPNLPGEDNKKRTASMIEYWFRGTNYSYTILHEFINVHNKSISERGCGCNQYLLNQIKREVIEAVKTNLNVNDIGEIDSEELKVQYGKNISMYKMRTKKLLKKTSIEEFCETYITLLNDIERNEIPWANMLHDKNRYWLISTQDDDSKERELFLSTYGHNDELYIAVLVIMKEYLLWQLCELISNKSNYWNTVFSKKNFIKNPKCSVKELFDWKRMWVNTKAITITLSICYKQVWEDTIVRFMSQFRCFRNNLYAQIYS